MTIAALQLEDGTYKFVALSAPLSSFVLLIRQLPVETIVFGEKTEDDQLVWEKNFTGGEPYNIDALVKKGKLK